MVRPATGPDNECPHKPRERVPAVAGMDGYGRGLAVGQNRGLQCVCVDVQHGIAPIDSSSFRYIDLND